MIGHVTGFSRDWKILPSSSSRLEPSFTHLFSHLNIRRWWMSSSCCVNCCMCVISAWIMTTIGCRIVFPPCASGKANIALAVLLLMCHASLTPIIHLPYRLASSVSDHGHMAAEYLNQDSCSMHATGTICLVRNGCTLHLSLRFAITEYICCFSFRNDPVSEQCIPRYLYGLAGSSGVSGTLSIMKLIVSSASFLRKSHPEASDLEAFTCIPLH